jgi:hypothetical protein
LRSLRKGEEETGLNKERAPYVIRPVTRDGNYFPQLTQAFDQRVLVLGGGTREDLQGRQNLTKNKRAFRRTKVTIEKEGGGEREREGIAPCQSPRD